MQMLESGGFFLEISDKGFMLYTEETTVKKPQKDFISAVFFFMKRNFIPVNFWKNVVVLEKMLNSNLV